MSNESQRFSSIWDALEDLPESAEQMKVKSMLMIGLTELITGKEWTRSRAAIETNVPEARIAELMEGRIDLFTEDALRSMLAAAGLPSG